MPAPFKSALPWIPKKAVKRAAVGTQKPKPKKPAFLTSDGFISTLKEAEDKKRKLQQDKLDRKNKRELKAIEKIAEAEYKKQKLQQNTLDRENKRELKASEKKAKLLAMENKENTKQRQRQQIASDL